MQYSENGGVVLHCKRCGRRLEIENYFEGVARKYCKQCAQDRKREWNAEYMRRQRAEARERRELERRQARLTADENELLRQIVRQQAARIEQLKKVEEKL